MEFAKKIENSWRFFHLTLIIVLEKIKLSREIMYTTFDRVGLFAPMKYELIKSSKFFV